jgi:hypothetical protein
VTIRLAAAAEESTGLYKRLARERPNEVELGGAFVTMVEPHVGFERRYNRWYEDDHFYAGLMHGPWIFAGRRWVAPRRLQELRAPAESPIARPLRAGCYVSTYWFTAGHEDDAEEWLHAVAAELAPAGRGLADPSEEPGGPARPIGRTHVYSHVHRFVFGAARDDGPLRPEHALDHPFRGMVLELVERPAGTAAFADVLRDHLVAALGGTSAALVVVLEPVAFAGGMNEAALVQPEGLGQRLCLLWFVDEEPTDPLPVPLEEHERFLRDQGARLLLTAPFVPTVPGTDRYVDELR